MLYRSLLLEQLFFYYQNNENELGAYDNVVPPLPIPNREVKCVYADGTTNVGE